ATVYRRSCYVLARYSAAAGWNLALPASLIPIVRALPPTMKGSTIGRLDLGRTDSGYKLMEFNADESGLIVEAFSVNQVACGAAGLEDANAGCEVLLCRTLEDAVRAGLQSLSVPPALQPAVVVTAFGN